MTSPSGNTSKYIFVDENDSLREHYLFEERSSCYQKTQSDKKRKLDDLSAIREKNPALKRSKLTQLKEINDQADEHLQLLDPEVENRSKRKTYHQYKYLKNSHIKKNSKKIVNYETHVFKWPIEKNNPDLNQQRRPNAIDVDEKTPDPFFFASFRSRNQDDKLEEDPFNSKSSIDPTLLITAFKFFKRN